MRLDFDPAIRERMINDIIMRKMTAGDRRGPRPHSAFEVADYLPAFAGRPRLVGAAVEAFWRGAALVRF
jgi:hypothetical protein